MSVVKGYCKASSGFLSHWALSGGTLLESYNISSMVRFQVEPCRIFLCSLSYAMLLALLDIGTQHPTTTDTWHPTRRKSGVGESSLTYEFIWWVAVGATHFGIHLGGYHRVPPESKISRILLGFVCQVQGGCNSLVIVWIWWMAGNNIYLKHKDKTMMSQYC